MTHTLNKLMIAGICAFGLFSCSQLDESSEVQSKKSVTQEKLEKPSNVGKNDDKIEEIEVSSLEELTQNDDILGLKCSKKKEKRRICSASITRAQCEASSGASYVNSNIVCGGPACIYYIETCK